MNDFYILRMTRFSQSFAWYETAPSAVYSDCLRCPGCNNPISMLHWEPPYDVVIKNPKRLGDFVAGAGGCDFLVSERFISLYKEEGLTGIHEILPINIIQMGTTKKSKQMIPPKLFGVYLLRSMTRVNYDEMGIDWMTEPSNDYCRLCGPGGGSSGGSWKSRERIVIEQDTWNGEDLFHPINHSGTYMLSSDAADFISKYDFTNAEVIPAKQAAYSFAKD